MNKILPKDNTEGESNTSNVPSEVLYDTDDWCEVEEHPAEVTDTLLEQTNIAENADKIISFAPGEGNKPLGIFVDKDSEYLSFPSVFCRKGRPGMKMMKDRSLYLTVQLLSGNYEVGIEEPQCLSLAFSIS